MKYKYLHIVSILCFCTLTLIAQIPQTGKLFHLDFERPYESQSPQNRTVTGGIFENAFFAPNTNSGYNTSRGSVGVNGIDYSNNALAISTTGANYDAFSIAISLFPFSTSQIGPSYTTNEDALIIGGWGDPDSYFTNNSALPAYRLTKTRFGYKVSLSNQYWTCNNSTCQNLRNVDFDITVPGGGFDKWQQVVVTWQTGDNVRFYLNGTEYAVSSHLGLTTVAGRDFANVFSKYGNTSPATNNAVVYPNNVNLIYKQGTQTHGVNFPNYSFQGFNYDGYFDDAIVYNRKISASEVTEIYNTLGVPRVPTTISFTGSGLILNQAVNLTTQFSSNATGAMTFQQLTELGGYDGKGNIVLPSATLNGSNMTGLVASKIIRVKVNVAGTSEHNAYTAEFDLSVGTASGTNTSTPGTNTSTPGTNVSITLLQTSVSLANTINNVLVSITGTGFQVGATVTVGGIVLTNVVVSGNIITGTIPANSTVANPTSPTIIVQNPNSTAVLTGSFTPSVQLITSIKKNTSETFAISPNPSTGFVKISATVDLVNVYNIVGNLVVSATSNEFYIPAKGLFIVEIIAKNIKYYSKVVVE